MYRSGTRTARLIALSMAIQEGQFDPDNANMSEIADALGVNRSTIMKDFDVIRSVFVESGEMQAKLRSTSVANSYRRKAAAVEMGSVKSDAKSSAARENGKKGGRPRKAKE